MSGTPRHERVSTKRQRIAELAENCPDMAFTNLAHHIDIEWMLTAHGHTRRDGAVGVDGQTAEEYEVNLEAKLQNLLDRAKSGTYVAPPVRRVHIPKAGSSNETRPLGIPTYEDKILQRAVLMVLEPVYETDFLDVSHGFRPGRGAHGALDSLWKQEMKLGGDWIVDVDLRKFFDTIDHGHLREFLRRRVRDGVILRLIGKWLNAGVLEEGVLTIPDDGTPQGGVISKRALSKLSEWCRKNMHLPIKEQHQKLTQKLRGHYGYYGIIGNFYSLLEFRETARGIWRRQLSRRRRCQPMAWSRFARLEERYNLPRTRVVHGMVSGVAK
jgi:retron-type reverse transcriptase